MQIRRSQRTRFKIQRNLCVTLLTKAKRGYYENLELGKVNDSKKFWNAVKPVLGNKVTTTTNITQIENKIMVTSEIELAKTFNKYFVDIVPKLGIKTIDFIRNKDVETGNLSTIIKKYKNYSSIIALEKYMKGVWKKNRLISAKLQMIQF